MRILARVLAVGVIFVVGAIFIMPWQQSVRATGRVIAFNPLDRRVNIEAPVEGRVKRVYVVENQVVRRGDFIADIQDNDPNLLVNLRLQHDATVARRAAALTDHATGCAGAPEVLSQGPRPRWPWPRP